MLLLLLLACDDGSEPPAPDGGAPVDTDTGVPCDTPAQWWPDSDADGFGDAEAAAVEACTAPAGHVAEATDCDDARATVWPGAEELCDGLDQDCDNRVDDGLDLREWYLDEDGDGYGNGTSWTYACAAPSGRVSDATDCDDDDPGVSPGAAEVCDGVDQDCDGAADDGLLYESWTDADGDGYGDPASYAATCTLPPDAILNGEDCDDARADVSPDGAEVCGNGLDDDCDGNANGCGIEGAWSTADGADAILLGAQEEDFAGLKFAPAGDVDGDGYADALVSGLGRDTFAGAAHLVRGPVAGTTSLGDAALTLTGAGDYVYLGSAVAGVGDATGDGVPDLLVGARGAYGEAGVALLVDGDLTGTHNAWAASDTWLYGAQTEDGAGSSLAGLGDIDGDGLADLLIGAPELLSGRRGKAHVVVSGQTGEVELADTPTLTSSETRTGIEVSGADLDGDGIGDAVIRSWKHVYVVYLPVSADVDLAAADITVASAADELGAGRAVGDLDGDGLPDLVLGEPEEGGGAGSVRIYTGLGAGSFTIADAAVVVTGMEADDNLGFGVAPAGDVDGDGRDDALATAMYGGTDDLGAAYVLGKSTFSLAGQDRAYVTAGGVGDLDADGFDDVLVGAIYDDSAGNAAGAAYLFAGGAGW